MSMPVKIRCKKLSSGKCQVKFFTMRNNVNYYGYMLTNPDDKLKDVIATINNEFKQKDVLHRHLYSIGQKDNQHFLLYKA